MTLKQITKIIIDFFEAHLMVNSVTKHTVKGFIGNRDKVYSVANVEFLDSAINGKIRTDSFQITLADLLTPTKDNEFDIYSDTIEIAEDFFTHLQYNPAFTFNKSVNSQKFSEEDGDIIAGITFKISLQTVRPQNECNIPLVEEDNLNHSFPVPLD